MPHPASRPITTSSPTWKSSVADRITSPGGLVLSATLLALILPVTSAIRDPDFWWHLRAGEIMIASHQLITTDPFTYTVTGSHWTMHEWATEVSFAWLHDVGGLGLIVALLAAITWFGLLAIWLRARLERPNPFVLAAGMVMAGLVGYPIWGPRVQMLTFALAALVLLLADQHLRRGGRAIWALVPIFLLWSNFHSGFIIGIGFLVLVGAAELVGHWLNWPDGATPARARTLFLVAAAGAGAAMVNPNGPSIVLYPFATQASAAQQAVIQEWHSPNFHTWEIFLFFAPMAFSLALLLVLNRRIRARDSALLIVTVMLAFQSVRHIALFVAAATPIWINQASLLWERLMPAPKHASRIKPILPPLGLRVTVYSLVMLVVAAAAAARIATALAVREDSLSYANDYPVCAVRWLLTAPPNLKIFNQYGEGGYLTDKLNSRGDKVFVFGDAALMGDALLETYGQIESVQWDWNKTIDAYHTDLIVFDTHQPITEVIERSVRWTKVYSDNHTVVFAPTDRLAQLGLPTQPALSADPNDTCSQLANTPPPEVGQ